MNFKNLNFLFFYCFTLIISGTLFSQEMEFPEDKVKYTINIVQEECVVTILAWNNGNFNLLLYWFVLKQYLQ